MKITITLFCICLLFVGCTSTPDIATEERARVPYAELHKAATLDVEGMDGVNITNKIHKVVMSSTIPDVKPKDIKLYINSKSGKIPFDVNDDGTVNLPRNTGLLEENPFVFANQPAGTLERKTLFPCRSAPAYNSVALVACMTIPFIVVTER